MRRIFPIFPIFPVFLLALLVASCGSAQQATGVRSAVAPSARKALPAVPHIFVIMMENHSSSDILGNAGAPALNHLIQTYGYAARYYGVTHPSLPNYVATITGDSFGSHSDNPSQRFAGRNLADQLEAHGRSWKAYMQSMPSPGYGGDAYPPGPFALYARKHDPFMLMDDVLGSQARMRRVVPVTQLSRDLRSGSIPDFAYIVPDLCHDMHGIGGSGSPCPYGSEALIAAGSAFVGHTVSDIVRSRAWTGDSTIFVAWDEGDSDFDISGCCAGPRLGGGRTLAIVIARQGARQFTANTPYNHFSLLATIETVWHLGCLRHTCGAAVRPMTEFLSRR